MAEVNRKASKGIPRTLEAALLQGYYHGDGSDFSVGFVGGLGGVSEVEGEVSFQCAADGKPALIIPFTGKLTFGQPELEQPAKAETRGSCAEVNLENAKGR